MPRPALCRADTGSRPARAETSAKHPHNRDGRSLGTEVTLPDGRVGVVAAADADRPHEPLVRVEGSDLRVQLRDAAAV
jgi:hypothetical protein